MSAIADPFELLSPTARKSLAAIAARLQSDWRLTNPRRTATGWAVTMQSADGTYAGEIGILDDLPAQLPPRATKRT